MAAMLLVRCGIGATAAGMFAVLAGVVKRELVQSKSDEKPSG